MVAGDPGQGGATWAVLQYVLGLRELGHDVLLLEPAAQPTDASRRYFAEVVRSFGLEGRSALGSLPAGLRAEARCADVLLNVAGMLVDEELLARIPVRLYLDLDPGFTQLWHAVAGIDMRLAGHTHFATVGQAIGTPGCPAPTCGVPWIHVLPPVVLSHWRPGDGVRHDGFTTVGNWRSYGSIWHAGTLFGQRAHSFRQLFELPERVRARLLPALAIHPGESRDLEALRAHGWELLDPAVVAATPAAYRSFVRGSRAELGVAKSGYVLSRCGWFSDRSACYLASGRPVLAQDTGFAAGLPAGEGLLAFSNVDEAAAGVDEICARYRAHAAAARELAAAYLDSRLVLTRLLSCL
jgi:hypothetical protein